MGRIVGYIKKWLIDYILPNVFFSETRVFILQKLGVKILGHAYFMKGLKIRVGGAFF